MDIPQLSQIVKELAHALTGARVERVYQGREGGLYCIFRRERKNFILLLSPDRLLPRLHLVSAKPAAEPAPHPFVLYLRSRLTGTRVGAVALLNHDRVVEFRFAGAGTAYRLVFELTGSSPNLIAADGSLKILAVYYPKPLSPHTARPLLPGLSYVPPEKRPAHSPGEDLPTAEYHPRNTGTVSPNREAEAYFQRVQEERALLSLRKESSSCIRKALSKVERRIAAISGDLSSAKRADEYRQAGELVLANLGRLATGMDQAELTGYDGKTVAVRLDPKLTPAGNADGYFKKYKKAKAGRHILARRLEEAEEEASRLQSLQTRLEQAEGRTGLISIRTALVDGGYLKKAGKGRAHPAPVTPGYRVLLFNGWEILVGKGAKGNDYITTKIARPDDLWLHAEGMPGSHVLIKNPGKSDIPADVIVRAAALAAFHSKGKRAGKVSVTYTRAGLVKKPKGAKPGLVTLQERKSLMVKPEG